MEALVRAQCTNAPSRSHRSPRSTARRRLRSHWRGSDPHILLIPGTSSLAHLEENVASAAIVLDADNMAALDHSGQS
jgi:aryl-alcohol dehydrogenase-like predicted oxidoreductase